MQYSITELQRKDSLYRTLHLALGKQPEYP